MVINMQNIHKPGFGEIVEDQTRIRNLRKIAKLKQKDVVKKFGISQSMLSRIENGSVSIGCKKLKELYDFYLRIIEGKEKKDIIGNYMTGKIISVDKKDSIGKAKDVMVSNEFSQLPVKEGEKFVGSIDEDSLIGVNKEERIEKVMKESFPVFPYDMEKKRVEEFFKNNPEVKAVLVAKKGKIRGIITRYDLYSK